MNAQALREKSHQLLEFITDPVMNQRNLLAASLGPLDRRRGRSFLAGTPDHDDGDADGESDDDRSRRGVSERVFHGLNGNGALHFTLSESEDLIHSRGCDAMHSS